MKPSLFFSLDKMYLCVHFHHFILSHVYTELCYLELDGSEPCSLLNEYFWDIYCFQLTTGWNICLIRFLLILWRLWKNSTSFCSHCVSSVPCTRCSTLRTKGISVCFIFEQQYRLRSIKVCFYSRIVREKVLIAVSTRCFS